LFFALYTSIDLGTDYPEVILLDCTYKTIHFGIPRLNIIGITGLGTTFHLAFLVLKSVIERVFTWALEQLEKIMPSPSNVFVTERDCALMNQHSTILPKYAQFLCQWHIGMNDVARAKVHLCDGLRQAGESDAASSSRDPRDMADVFVKAWDGVMYSDSELDFRMK
jgi:hypothetical protein